MRAVFSRATLCCNVLEGSAEGIPLGDDSVDGVFCADCFHRFDWPVAIPRSSASCDRAASFRT